MNRRDWLAASAAATGSALTFGFRKARYSRDLRPARSRVAVLHADQYSDKLDELIYEGLQMFDLKIRGKSVLLKPNIVEYIPGRPINTDTQLIGAAAEGFLRLGATSVTVAEGPGHHRDTELLLYETGLGQLWLPRTVLAADFIVSMPKVKTHHWTGVTLSMKNMFGIVPGSRYGWPKNVLHWAGIHECVLDICATVRPHFVIADGIVAMEGDGPLNGFARNLGTLLLSDDPVTADSLLARMLGFEPNLIRYIQE